MKNLTSITEGVWTEVKPVALTEEQKAIFKSSDIEAKATLSTELKSLSETTPDEITLALAKAKYNYIKAKILSNGTYELIGCNISLDSTKLKGILNCRVNGEHKQIRF